MTVRSVIARAACCAAVILSAAAASAAEPAPASPTATPSTTKPSTTTPPTKTTATKSPTTTKATPTPTDKAATTTKTAATATGTTATPAGTAATTTATPTTGKTTAPAPTAATAPTTGKTTATTPAATTATKAKTTPTPAAEKTTAAKPTTKSARADSTMTLRGGQEGTVFRTLTVEGEDRVHFEFERPALNFDLDPDRAPGLEPASTRAAIERAAPDMTAPLLSLSARESCPYLARPWLSQYTSGAVARFRPDVKGIERWRLVVADSRGQAVATFEGKGDPPREIAWDGRTKGGKAAVPGFTYSYVFEAYDRAGNKRNFVGPGFRIPAYRIDTVAGPLLVCSGEDLGTAFLSRDLSAGPAAPPPIVLEAATWINQSANPSQKLRVTVTARAFDRASAIANEIARQLGTLTIGDPGRIQAVAAVEADAPQTGTLRIEQVH